jgi:transposase InsO family protein
VSRLYTRDTKTYPVRSQCELLGVSPQAYYKHGDTYLRKLAEEAFCVEFVKRIRRKDRGIGGGKLWQMYRREFGDEHSVGYNRFYDIIERHDLKVRKRKRRAKTTDSNHDLPLYPNLVKDLIPLRPNQLWVSDITYMVIYLNAQTGDYEFCYLSLVTDYYTKEIIGWCVGETLEAKFAIEALNMALKRLGGNPVPDLIHHSDRGVQYASYEYTGILKKNGIKISMTECGDPKDNAVAERVNGIIKNELLMGMKFFSIEEVRNALKVAIDFYNNERPHMSLDWKTPAEAALCMGEMEKKWKSYREKAIKALAA